MGVTKSQVKSSFMLLHKSNGNITFLGELLSAHILHNIAPRLVSWPRCFCGEGAMSTSDCEGDGE